MPELLLPLRKRLAARDAKLPLDQVLAGNLLGHRMLDLEPRVHFHEPDAVRPQPFDAIGDELDRPRSDIVDRLRRLHRRAAHAARVASSMPGAGASSITFWCAAERAIALEQVDDIAVAVAEHLHLDMARAKDIFLDQHPVVAERGRGSRLQDSSMSWNSADALTRRIPLPPPPATALISTG
jgi:hypothetical protein